MTTSGKPPALVTVDKTHVRDSIRGFPCKVRTCLVRLAERARIAACAWL
jgi:hypothetical protein